MSTSPRQRIAWPKILVITALLCGVTFFILPKYSRPREGHPLSSIGNNLRIIESAKEQWALENNKQTNDAVTLVDLTLYFKNNKLPAPIVGETYLVDKI